MKESPKNTEEPPSRRNVLAQAVTERIERNGHQFPSASTSTTDPLSSTASSTRESCGANASPRTSAPPHTENEPDTVPLESETQCSRPPPPSGESITMINPSPGNVDRRIDPAGQAAPEKLDTAPADGREDPMLSTPSRPVRACRHATTLAPAQATPQPHPVRGTKRKTTDHNKGGPKEKKRKTVTIPSKFRWQNDGIITAIETFLEIHKSSMSDATRFSYTAELVDCIESNSKRRSSAVREEELETLWKEASEREEDRSKDEIICRVHDTWLGWKIHLFLTYLSLCNRRAAYGFSVVPTKVTWYLGRSPRFTIISRRFGLRCHGS
jgi:hypothetical protein